MIIWINKIGLLRDIKLIYLILLNIYIYYIIIFNICENYIFELRFFKYKKVYIECKLVVVLVWFYLVCIRIV